jgi:WD40 repeat protein
LKSRPLGRIARGVEAPSEVLISGAADNTTRIWDANAGKELAVLNHPRTVFLYFPRFTFLFVLGSSGVHL